MIDKRASNAAEAVFGIADGATVLVSGFGEAGSPTDLMHAMIDLGVRDLTVVSNNAGNGHVGLAALIEAGRVRRIVCSFPRSSDAGVFIAAYRTGSNRARRRPSGYACRAHSRGRRGYSGILYTNQRWHTARKGQRRYTSSTDALT